MVYTPACVLVAERGVLCRSELKYNDSRLYICFLFREKTKLRKVPSSDWSPETLPIGQPETINRSSFRAINYRCPSGREVNSRKRRKRNLNSYSILTYPTLRNQRGNLGKSGKPYIEQKSEDNYFGNIID